MEEEEEDEEEVEKEKYRERDTISVGLILGIVSVLLVIFLLGFEFGSHIKRLEFKICTNPPEIITKYGRKRLAMAKFWKPLPDGYRDKDTFVYYCSQAPNSRMYAIYQCNALFNHWEPLYETTCECREALPLVAGTLVRIPAEIPNPIIDSRVVYKCSASKDARTRAVYRCGNSSSWELIIDHSDACDCFFEDPPAPMRNQLRVWEGFGSRNFGTLVKYFCLSDDKSAIEKIVRCETDRHWKIVYQGFCGCRGPPYDIIDSKYYDLFSETQVEIGEIVPVYCDPKNSKSGLRFVVECNKTAQWWHGGELDCVVAFRVIPVKYYYDDAKDECWKRGGNLLVPKSEKDLEKLSEVVEAHLPNCQNFYLGIEEDLSETWYSEGKSYQFDPEIENNFKSDENKCIVMNNTLIRGKRMIFNEDCSNLHCYICHFPNNATEPFQAFKNRVDFQEALISCDIEGYLAPLCALKYLVYYLDIDEEINEYCDGIYYLNGKSIGRKWTTFEYEPLEFTDWSPHVSSNFSDHCVVSSGEHDLQWVTTHCHTLQCSICEIPKKLFWPDKPPSEQVDASKCTEPVELNLTALDPDIYSWPNKSQEIGAKIFIYCFRDKATTYQEYECSGGSWTLMKDKACAQSFEPFAHLRTASDSAKICDLLKGTLAMAYDTKLFNDLTTVIGKEKKKKLHYHCPFGYTIGMFEDEEKQWEIKSCPNMDPGYLNISRSKWASSKHPDSVKKKCLVIHKQSGNKLINENCAEKNCFVCENYNLEYTVRSRFLAYDDAVAECNKRQLTLATFRDEDDFAALQEAVNDATNEYCNKYFIGVRNFERHFYWLTKETPAKIHEKSNENTMQMFNEHCVSLRYHDYLLEDISCDSYTNCFVCSLSPNYFDQRTLDFNATTKCLKGFQLVGVKCYKLNTNPKMDSQSAQQECLKFGATLAVVTNDKELRRLHNAMKPHIEFSTTMWHIGLTVEDGRIEWRNGEKYNGFPVVANDVEESKCGAIISDGVTFDIQTDSFICNEAENYICEQDKYFHGFHEDIDELFSGGMSVPVTARSLTGCKEACTDYPFYTFNAIGYCTCRSGPNNHHLFFRLSKETLLNSYDYYKCSDFTHCKDTRKQFCECDDKPALYSYGWPMYLGCFTLISRLPFEKTNKERNESEEETSTHWCPISCWQHRFSYAILSIKKNSCRCTYNPPEVIPGQDKDCQGNSTFVRLYRM